MTSPAAASNEELLNLQRQFGNRAVGRLLDGSGARTPNQLAGAEPPGQQPDTEGDALQLMPGSEPALAKSRPEASSLAAASATAALVQRTGLARPMLTGATALQRANGSGKKRGKKRGGRQSRTTTPPTTTSTTPLPTTGQPPATAGIFSRLWNGLKAFSAAVLNSVKLGGAGEMSTRFIEKLPFKYQLAANSFEGELGPVTAMPLIPSVAGIDLSLAAKGAVKEEEPTTVKEKLKKTVQDTGTGVATGAGDYGLGGMWNWFWGTGGRANH